MVLLQTGHSRVTKMAKTNGSLNLAGLTALAGAVLLVSGCVSSPTYGTGKTANAQLSEDLGNIFSPLPKKKPAIAYNPRPDIVKPGAETIKSDAAALPAPQQKIAEGNPAWPESPEQRRARIRETATKNQNNPGFVPEVAIEGANGGITSASTGQVEPTEANSLLQRQEYKRRRVENSQGSATTRKFLSEPPLEYRVPAATAAADELGEDESKKERRIKKANKKKGKSSIRDLWPF